MKFHLKILAFSSILLVIGASPKQTIIPAARMNPRLQFTGFSIARPPDKGWLAILEEQTPTTALFRKYLKNESNTHTFFVKVELRKLPNAPKTLDDFVNLEKKTHAFEDTERFKLLDFSTISGIKQRQWCVYWKESSMDLYPDITPSVPLSVRVRGFTCLHPSLEKIVVYAQCSERGLEDELDRILFAEGMAILESIQLEKVQLDSTAGKILK